MISPELSEVYEKIEARGDDHVWITVRPYDEVAADAGRPGPLSGVPFAVKDNIDIAGLPTTAACPSYSYVPTGSAPLVDRLLAAGALLVGKTNLDQFATGLSGARSPYGTCESPLVPGLIAGGSSSGSAVAVAAGLVPFAIGTDTAGSGRVPAVMTGTVGLKPSRGLVSTLGVVPACASLDCPSIFARSVADALEVLAVIAGPEPDDPWSRSLPVPGPVPVATGPLRIGVPDRPEFSGDGAAAVAFTEALDRLAGLGHTLIPIDLSPFLAAGRLLYGGPWLAERLTGIGDFVKAHPDELHPVTRRVLYGADTLSATSAFRGLHELQTLHRRTEAVWAEIDALAVPTVPTTYTVREMDEDPIGRNTILGRYTTFANLLDLAAIAVPAGTTAIGRPHGITFLGPAGTDALLAGAAAAFHATCGGPPLKTPARPATPPTSPAAPSVALPAAPPIAPPTALSGLSAPSTITARPAALSAAPSVISSVAPAGSVDRPLLAVVGAHRAGQPLHRYLTELGAIAHGTVRTAPIYRLYALNGGSPPRPGLIREQSGGLPIEVELYELGPAGLGTLLTQNRPPLSLGTVRLDDGREVLGFLCEPYAVHDATDISHHGSWLTYLGAVKGSGSPMS